MYVKITSYTMYRLISHDGMAQTKRLNLARAWLGCPHYHFQAFLFFFFFCFFFIANPLFCLRPAVDLPQHDSSWKVLSVFSPLAPALVYFSAPKRGLPGAKCLADPSLHTWWGTNQITWHIKIPRSNIPYLLRVLYHVTEEDNPALNMLSP